MFKNIVYIQPYYFWKGHYKKYFDSVANKKLSIRSGVEVKSYILNYNKNFLTYSFSRILNNFFCILYLQKLIFSKKKKIDKIHFLEFEPLSMFIFLLFNLFFQKEFIITIHSTKLSRSKIPFILNIIQRLIFYLNILILNFYKCKIIVHKSIDKKNLKSFFFKKMFVLDYPAEKIFITKTKNYKKNFSFLIFGQIRRDKGIEDFFEKNKSLNKFKITIAGQIENKIYWKKKQTNMDLKIYDKFINKKFLKKLIRNHDFNFLPYSHNYAGSAGPLKLSTSFGQPVICSNIPIFKEFLKKNKIGFIFSKNLQDKLKKIDNTSYKILSKNCLEYCKSNNFNNFKSKHTKIYFD